MDNNDNFNLTTTDILCISIIAPLIYGAILLGISALFFHLMSGVIGFYIYYSILIYLYTFIFLILLFNLIVKYSMVEDNEKTIRIWWLQTPKRGWMAALWPIGILYAVYWLFSKLLNVILKSFKLSSNKKKYWTWREKLLNIAIQLNGKSSVAEMYKELQQENKKIEQEKKELQKKIDCFTEIPQNANNTRKIEL
jgi:hypothetical protein